MKILVTGGAGFIGLALVKKLLSANHHVVVLDSFLTKIYGKDEKRSDIYKIKNKNLIIIKDRVGNIAKHHNKIGEVDLIYHLASETGTGESMYRVSKYINSNILDTGKLVNYLKKYQLKSLKKIILTSSRSIYGEGSYRFAKHIFYPDQRDEDRLSKSDFEIYHNNKRLKPIPTKVESRINPLSVYASTKASQEFLLQNFANQEQIQLFIFRLQNVYGPGQSLNNPYTGIISIFSTLLATDNEINIFEDGNESRDFVYIDDVVHYLFLVLAIKNRNKIINFFNVGSGKQTKVIDLAKKLKRIFNSKSKIQITGYYRLGDIRHNFACMSDTKKFFNYSPKVSLNNGLLLFYNDFMGSGSDKKSAKLYQKSLGELKKFNILKK